MIKKEMENIEVQGCPDVRLSLKLSRLRQIISDWKKQTLGKENEEEVTLRQELESYEKLLDERDLLEYEVWILDETKKRLRELEELKYLDLKQRARNNWATFGDENSKFFHGVINKRRVRNNIPGLLVNGEWVHKPTEVKKEVYGFFRSKFVETMKSRPSLKISDLTYLNESEALMLVEQFTMKEIKEAVFECGDDKAPGPDGFNFRFIKHFWKEFEGDFYSLMQHFHTDGKLSLGVGSSFITLVPKTGDPTGLAEYRPINLIGVISKVVSKVLANRLKRVMGKVVSDNQSAFLSGRYILDGPLMINEVMSWARRVNKEIFLFKIDFEKAYDNVNWAFLLSMLDQMGFPALWCKWVKGVLESARSSVLVNGSPTFEFNCQKGIRQGDPASPFLFLAVMEALSGMIKKACSVGVFEGIRLPNQGPILSHLLYADDAMIMGEWSELNFANLKRILRIFYLCSGLKINLHKSVVYGVGVSVEMLNAKAGVLGCKAGAVPFVYLGIKVGANMNRVNNWEPVIDTFRSRLSKWKADSLSIGGRIILIKSVLESLPTYYLSLFKAPVAVVDKLESMIKRFLWGGSPEVRKTHWVSWDRTTCPKNEGGLGLTKLSLCNNALIIKWIWRYKSEQGALWRRMIEAIHGSTRRWEMMSCNKRYGGVWKNIVSFGNKVKINGKGLSHILRGVVGDGLAVRFWYDPWLNDNILKDIFPNIFRLEKDKACYVADRCRRTGVDIVVCWSWNKIPSTNVEVQERSVCEGMLQNVRLLSRPDQWQWTISADKSFSVGEAKKWLRSEVGIRNLSDGRFIYNWCKWVPNKCNVFMWRAELDRLPTKLALRRRSINVEDMGCSLCGEGVETVDHLFTACSVSCGVWSVVSNWCKVPQIFAFTFKDLLELGSNISGSIAKKKAFYGVVIIVCWRIWKARNDKIFSNKSTKVMDMVSDVKAFCFLWFRNRCKRYEVDWEEWCRFDLM
ncbi:putative RNA-directed DNA polymerase [Helianthus annuus]|nr:putative RNA-directed DNA polymerase [Helianthus annuus]